MQSDHSLIGVFANPTGLILSSVVRWLKCVLLHDAVMNCHCLVIISFPFFGASEGWPLLGDFNYIFVPNEIPQMPIAEMGNESESV